MTAYELASLHSQIGDNMNAALTNWLAIFSIYLGAGYLIAHRLSLSSAIALNGIFIVVLGGFARVMYGTFVSFVGVSREIRKLAEQGSGLEWHQAVKMTPFALENFPTVSAIFLWLSLAGAVYFFFSNRRQNLKTSTPA